MKSRDEAKKMAEEWIAHRVKNYEPGNVRTSACHDLMAGFMKCYDAMTKGKPDGYVTLTPDGSKNSLCLAKGMAIDRLVCPESRCWKTSEEWMAYRDNAWLEYQAQGWQIVPVKLIKVEAK